MLDQRNYFFNIRWIFKTLFHKRLCLKTNYFRRDTLMLLIFKQKMIKKLKIPNSNFFIKDKNLKILWNCQFKCYQQQHKDPTYANY